MRSTNWRVSIACLALIVSLSATRAPWAEVSFDDYSLPVQNGPVRLSPSDCNGDGIPDLIVANQESSNVTILRNRGDGTFAFWKTIPVTTVQPTPGGTPGPTPTITPNPAWTPEPGKLSSAVCGDFTNDGFVDVAVAIRRDPGLVMLLKSDATGTFTSLPPIETDGFSPNALSAADLNHDGKLDLVVVNANSNDMTVLLGDAAGGFPTVSTIPVPGVGHTNRPASAAVADYNLDGNLDIAVVSKGDPSLRLYLGNGAGEFEKFEGALPTLLKPYAVASADVDRDGIPDLAVATVDSTATFYGGSGTGGFAPLDRLIIPAETSDLALADFNGDGLVDLALAYFKFNDVQVFLANGPHQYPFAARVPTSGRAIDQVVNPFGSAAARSTNDNGTELLSPNSTMRSLDLLTLPELGLAPVLTSLLTLTERPEAVLLADMNNDSIPDAVVVTKTAAGLTLQILNGDSDGNYAVPPPSSFISPYCGDGVLDRYETCDDGNDKAHDGCSPECRPELGRNIASIDATDLDADGNQDLVVSAPPSGLLLFGDGQSRFRELRKFAKIRPKTPIAIGDFNGDDAVDLLTLPRSGRGLALFINDGTGELANIPILSSLRFVPPLLAADFDQNGLPDVAVAYKENGPLRGTVLYNNGSGPLRMQGAFAPPPGLRSLAAADFDEDGLLDIFAVSRKSKVPAVLFRGSPTGTFHLAGAASLDATFTSSTITDLNEDLHQDVVFCDSQSGRSCSVRYGNGRGALAASAPQLPEEAYVGRQMHAIATIDMDGDGVLDFVSLSRRDKRAVIIFRYASSSQTERLELMTGIKPHSLAVGDLDGDGRPDLIVANQATDDLSIFLNRGARRFDTLPRMCLPGRKHPILGTCQGNLSPSAIAVADLNSDGRLDLAVAETGVSAVALLLNVNDSFTDGGLSDGGSLSTGASPVALAVADLNEDGVPDLATANRDSNDVSVFLSAAGGAYATTTLNSHGAEPAVVAIGDLNRNKHQDLIVVNMATNNLATFLNDGRGVFSFARVSQTRGRIIPKAACVADFDDDGQLDIAIGSHRTQDILVLRGTGDGSWARDERVYHVGSDPVALSCTDLDEDGRTDIIFGNRRAGRIDVIRNHL